MGITKCEKENDKHKKVGKIPKRNIRQKDVRIKICNAMNSFFLVSDGGKRRSKRDALLKNLA